MKDINFLEGKVKSTQSGDSVFVKTVITLVICIELALVALIYFYLILQTGKFNDEKAQINIEMKKYSQVSIQKRKIEDLNNRLTGMTEIINIVSKHCIINTQLMKEISAVMSDNMFLKGYSVSKKGEVNLEGVSKDEKDIAYFAHKLKETGNFEDVSVKVIDRYAVEGEIEEGYEFIIVIKTKS